MSSIKKLKLATVRNIDLEETKNARLVLSNAIKSTNAFYTTYQTGRVGSSGTTTHQQQDLLRAMLVFACSGLDAVIKQLVDDALPAIIDKDSGAQNEFEKYIDRILRKSTGGQQEDMAAAVINTKLLSELFASPQPRDKLVQLRLKELGSNSLQSRDQVLMVASCFAIESHKIMTDPDDTKITFDIRNQIIHEMDVNLDGKKKRRQRKVTAMTKYCENVLNVAISFINATTDKLGDVDSRSNE